jgi:predicted DNA-binding transcriptional regulator YafY
MLTTSARLLRLLTLLQTRRFWTGADLAERLEVTPRSLRRDMNRLRSLGYPVHAASGVAGGYQLGAGAALPPLQLDDDEALAVSLALSTAATGSISGIEEPAMRALTKLEQVLPSRLQRRAHTLRAAIVPLARAGAKVDAALLSKLASACRDHLVVSFDYADAKQRLSKRQVQPHGMVHTGLRWYLVAWDLTREDFRTFRVDRIGPSCAHGARFAPRPGPGNGDLKAYVLQSISGSACEAQAKVLLHAPASVAAQTLSPSAGYLEPVDEEHCLLLAGAPSLEALAVWLLLAGVHFEVQEPPELTAHLHALKARLDRALEVAPKRAPRKRSARTS